MSKEYQYRKFIRWGQYIIPIIMLLFVIGFGLLSISFFRLRQAFNPGAPMFPTFELIFGIGAICALSAMYLPVWYLYYSMAGLRVLFEQEALVVRRRRGETRIAFDQITKINLPSIPYLGGWITITAGKQKVRLTVMLNQIGDFVQSLKASLDEHGLSDRYHEARLFGFLKTAIYSDQGWERVHAHWWKWVLATLGTGLVGVGVAVAMTGIDSFFWILISLLFPLLVYILSEIPFLIRISRTADRERFFVPPRDPVYEKRVYTAAAIIGALVYLVIALVIVLVP